MLVRIGERGLLGRGGLLRCGFDWDNIIKDFPESLQKALDVIEQSGNADVVRGAMKMGEVQDADDGEHSGI